MKRLLLSLLFVLLTCPSSGAVQQDKDAVLLRWNVPEGKALGFKASFNQTSAKQGGMQFDVDALAEFAGTTPSKEARDRMKAFFEGFKLPKDYGMTLLLKRPAAGSMSVLFIAGKAPDVQTPIPKMTEMLKKMEGTVQLRGEVDDRGDITSFWLATNQKNLLALFCELPKEAVKVGSRWPLNVNFVQMGHGFVGEKAKRVNQVECSAIEKGADAEVVAVLDYLVVESVEGTFEMGEQKKPTTMAMSFAGRGRFSVTKGRWNSFSGIMKSKSTGMMSSSTEQELALEPLAFVPEDLLKLK